MQQPEQLPGAIHASVMCVALLDVPTQTINTRQKCFHSLQVTQIIFLGPDLAVGLSKSAKGICTQLILGMQEPGAHGERKTCLS